MGKRGNESDFKLGIEEAREAGAEVSTTPRGGETTYHGPGQLVAYPIVNLRGLQLGARAYVETLEDIMIDLAAHYGIQARVSYLPSVFVLFIENFKAYMLKVTGFYREEYLEELVSGLVKRSSVQLVLLFLGDSLDTAWL